MKPEIISQGDRELIVSMTILETKREKKLERLIYDAPDKQSHLITTLNVRSRGKQLVLFSRES